MNAPAHSGKMHRYVATVEGHEHGVPFRLFFKRIDKAEKLTREIPGAVLQSLDTLARRRWVNGEWHEA